MSVGGKNEYHYIAMDQRGYFFIDHDGQITKDEYIPFYYELKSLDEQQNIATAIDDLKTQMMELLSKL